MYVVVCVGIVWCIFVYKGSLFLCWWVLVLNIVDYEGFLGGLCSLVSYWGIFCRGGRNVD